MKRRLELVDAAKNHNKFWEVEVKGSQMIAHWGRIGTVGQNQVKDFGSPEKAKAAAEKMVAEKKAKGYVPVDGASKKMSSKSAKKSPKAKSKCAHCGRPSASPTDCPEPWEHHHFKGGCVGAKKVGGKRECAWCKANAFLTNDETNWLAKNGWSSTQIKEMNSSPKGRKEARALIKAGKPKKAGPVTEAAVKDVGRWRYGTQDYRNDLLKSGVSIATFDAWNGKPPSPARHLIDTVLREAPSKAVRCALENGVFTDGKRDILVIPSDKEFAKELREHLIAVQDVIDDENEDTAGLWIVDMIADLEKAFGLKDRR